MSSDLAGGASEAAVNADLERLESMYLDCAARFLALAQAVR